MVTDTPEIDNNPNLHGNERGTNGSYSGEEYDKQTKEKPRYVEVGASRGNQAADPAPINTNSHENIPTNAGKRAYVDEKTGEVYGSGAGAGGGTGTEDYDHDTSGGGNNDPRAQ